MKVKEWVKEHKGKLITVGIAGLVGVTAYILGRHTGKADFVQELIDHYETAPVDASGFHYNWPVFETRDPNFPNFIYEIKAECLGD